MEDVAGQETMNGSDTEFIKRELMRINVKLDALPQMYVTLAVFDPWRSAVDRRLDILEMDAKQGKQWANDEHSKLSTTVLEVEKRLATSMLEMERRLSDKVEENFKAGVEKDDQNLKLSMGMKITIALAVIGWLIGIIMFLLNVIHL